jgi:gliding motility-associated-like protein
MYIVFYKKVRNNLKMKNLLSLLFFLIIASTCFTQDFSNKGKEFWAVFPPHQPSNINNLATLSLYISSDKNSKGKILYGGTSISFDVLANQPKEYVLNRSLSYVSGAESANDLSPANLLKTVSNRGIKIVVDENQPPVVVYAHMYAGNRSTATIILPKSVLERRYMTYSYTQLPNGTSVGEESKSQFTIVAVEEKTKIKISLRKDGSASGTPYEIQLNSAGDVYNFQSDNDLTGTEIESIPDGDNPCKKIAVFSGSSSARIPAITSARSLDPLMQQCYPINTWGQQYFVTPIKGKNNFIFRVLAKEDNTTVKINNRVVNLNKGAFIESTNGIDQLPAFVVGNKPIAVAQYLQSQNLDLGVGDPEMILLNSVEQNIKNVSMFLSPKNAINEQNVNVVIRNEGIPSFKINGTSPNGSFKPIGTTGYSYLQESFTVSPSQYLGIQMTSDSGFNAFCYGFGNVESYGYSAGTNVRDLNQFISIKNEFSSIPFPATCKDAPFKFSVTLPFKPLRIQWKFNNSKEILEENKNIAVDPAPISNNGQPILPSSTTKSIADPNKELYVFQLEKKYLFKSKGTFPISIVVFNPTSDGCNGEQIIDFDLEVFDPPKTKFISKTTGCIEDPVKLEGQIESDGRTVNKFIWGFNNAAPDTTNNKNIDKLFNIEGDQKISLKIINDIGCISEEYSNIVKISNKPLPEFEVQQPTCIGKPVKLIDKSSINGISVIKEWKWTYSTKMLADTFTNTSITKSPTKIFDTSAVKIKLLVTSTSGCNNALEKEIKLFPNPVVNFELPDVCLDDAKANFSSITKIATAGTIKSLLWNFGDPLSTASLNEALGKEVSHAYSRSGLYNVTLRAESNDGCTDQLTKVLTVNGATPKANFSMVNENKLCSNADVYLVNESTVDFGNITRLEIYWNWDPTNPGSSPRLIDETPTPKKQYKYRYPDFRDVGSREYNIRLVAYSGGVCVNEITKPIKINGSPLVRFDSMPPLCQLDPIYKIDKASYTDVIGIANGSSSFSGPGVSPSGGFTPSITGPGIFTINYRFTASNGCYRDTFQSIKVFPNPIVNAGPDFKLFDDAEAIINATASGIDLVYRWDPPTYLNKIDTLNPIVIKPQDDILYTFSATGIGNCTTKDNVFVKVLRNPKPPNTFTPNGDGINDRWDIPDLKDYPNAVVEVYNAEGQLLFRSIGYPTPWDGKFNGKVLPFGTYYYVIDPKSGRKKIVGYVTIIN